MRMFGFEAASGLVAASAFEVAGAAQLSFR